MFCDLSVDLESLCNNLAFIRDEHVTVASTMLFTGLGDLFQYFFGPIYNYDAICIYQWVDLRTVDADLFVVGLEDSV